MVRYVRKRKSPSRRRFKRNYKRRYRLKRRRSRRTFVERARLGATQALCSHTYTDEIQISVTAAGETGMWPFCCNGIYDPNLTILGRNTIPVGFQTMANRFHHYTVLGSTITMQYLPLTSGNQQPAWFGILRSGGGAWIASNLTGTTFQLAKLKEVYMTYNQPFNAKYIMYTNQIQRSKNTFSAKKNFGRGKLKDDQYCGSATSNPAERMFYECWCAVPQNVALGNAVTYTFLISMRFKALWFEPKMARNGD